MINKVILIGNMGQDPDLKYTTNGNAVCNFTLATSEKYKDKSGEMIEKTEWHRVIVWQKLAETVEKYTQKGSKVYIEGKLETRKWQDSEGNDKYTTEIIAREVKFLDTKSTQEKPKMNGTDFSSNDVPF